MKLKHLTISALDEIIRAAKAAAWKKDELVRMELRRVGKDQLFSDEFWSQWENPFPTCREALTFRELVINLTEGAQAELMALYELASELRGPSFRCDHRHFQSLVRQANPNHVVDDLFDDIYCVAMRLREGLADLTSGRNRGATPSKRPKQAA